jgi:hypothetical protein
MPTLLIIVAVGAVYLLLQKQGVLGGSGSLAAQLNANQRNAQLQLRPIAYQASQPGFDSLEQQGIASGISGAQQSILQSSTQSSDSGQASAGAQAGIAALGIIGSVVGGLLAAHTARVKGATAENSGIDAIVPAFDKDMLEINAAYKSGSISGGMAVTYLSQVHDQYWQYMSSFNGHPGVQMRACPPGQVGGPMGKGGCTSGQPICDKGCTAGCCVGCSAINGSIANAIWAVQVGYHGQVAVCAIFAGKFGSHDRAGYTLSW